MKKYIIRLFSIFVICAALMSCKSDGLRNKEALIGDWHYAGTENGITEDVWLSLSADETFEMYQLIGEGAYWRSTGTYDVDIESGVISGMYSDQTPWGHDYEFSVSGNSLTLTAVDVPGYNTKYKREVIPDEVREKSMDLTKSDASEFVPYL